MVETERRRALEREAHTYEWWGSEDRQHAERMKACRERRQQYGEDDCDDRDGSCSECEQDMAEALETAASRTRRQAALAELSSITNREPQS